MLQYECRVDFESSSQQFKEGDVISSLTYESLKLEHKNKFEPLNMFQASSSQPLSSMFPRRVRIEEEITQITTAQGTISQEHQSISID